MESGVASICSIYVVYCVWMAVRMLVNGYERVVLARGYLYVVLARVTSGKRSGPEGNGGLARGYLYVVLARVTSGTEDWRAAIYI